MAADVNILRKVAMDINESDIEKLNNLEEPYRITNFTGNVYAVQQPTQDWLVGLEIIPFEILDNNTKDFRMPVELNSQTGYTSYEHAIEAGFDILESLGLMINQPVDVDLFVWNKTKGAHEHQLVCFDGENFLTTPESMNDD